MMDFSLNNTSRKRLLVASISDKASRDHPILPVFPAALRQLASSVGHGPHTHKLPHHALGQAGQELQKVTALIGGIVLAGIGQVAQNIASAARGDRLQHGQAVPFYQTFKLPWNNRSRSKHSSYRDAREAEVLAHNLMVRGRQYERTLDVRAAVQCFEEASKLSPTNLAYLCLAAKQWSDLTYFHDVKSDRERQLVNLKAVEFAERAVEAHPDAAPAYLGRCISKGRLALFMDNRNKVKLAKEAQEAARTALKLAPDDDIAHHLMGRWHYEMSRINVVVRTAVRLMYGANLEPGTREQALHHYHQAMQIAPHRLVHKVEAGRVYFDMGKHEEAKKHLYEALECEVEDINAWHTRMDCQMILAAIEGRPWVQPCMVPPIACVEPDSSSPKSK